MEQELGEYFYKVDLIDSTTLKAAWLCVGLAEILIPLFAVIALSWDYVSNTINNVIDDGKPKFFSLATWGRVIALMIVVGPVYIGVFWGIGNVADKLAEATEPTEAAYKKGKEQFSHMVIKMKDHDLEEGESEDKSVDGQQLPPPVDGNRDEEISFWGMLRDGVYSMVESLFSATTLIIISAIKLIIEGVAIMISKILFVIGPLVMAFSILPVFKDKVSQWFGVYLNALFVPVTCNLIDFIVYSNWAGSNMYTALGNVNDPVSSLIFNVVIIVVYIMAFWLTSFYVGSSTGGRVLTAAVSGAAQVVGFIAGGAAGATAMGKAVGSGDTPNIINDATSTTQTAK